MEKSQLSSFLVNFFAKINKLWILGEVPNLKVAVQALEQRAMSSTDLILGRLPATFSAKEVVDVLFNLAEGWLPQYATMLKWAQGLADALLQTPPAAAH